MAGSNWNAYIDRLLAADLTVEEHRLALALARLLLGWQRTSAPIGQRLLRERARLHGRSLDRALTGLREKGILTISGGGVGRGNRATYTLLTAVEKPAAGRAIQTYEKPARERAKARSVNARSQRQEKPAQERARIGSGKGKTPAQSADTVDPNELRREAFAAYLATGGSLELDRERSALARAVTAAVTAGTEQAVVLAACRDLGRKREFPGYLKQRIAEIVAAGGACTNQGADRAALTPQQLHECGCTTCTEWAEALSETEAALT